MIEEDRGRLHGRPAGAAFLFHANSRLPVVPGAQQVEPDRAAPPFAATGADEVLFIDARKLGHHGRPYPASEFSDEDIERIASTYHAWRGELDAPDYCDVPGFCKICDA
jgi:type I restriction-modification system DNA methylase subunit